MIWKMILEYVLNAIYIIEGYSIWLWTLISGRNDKKAAKRKEICSICEHNEKGICNLCGCVIKMKVYVDFDEDENGITTDGCPERKW